MLRLGAGWGGGRLRRGLGGEQLGAQSRGLGLSLSRGTVVVERWWKVPLSKEGRPPRLHPRRHRIYRLVEDTKNQPKGELEVILTQSVDNLGSRGDIVSVKKPLARNKLLLEGLAVYASPENKKMFEEEMRLRDEGKLERLQTQSGEKTIQFLRSCRLEVGMKNNVKWELNNEIVARHFLKNLNVFVTPHAVKLPDEPITRWGEYWCEVTGRRASSEMCRTKAELVSFTAVPICITSCLICHIEFPMRVCVRATFPCWLLQLSKLQACNCQYLLYMM
ncbi:39S ribosomal protein L9, mitochondrial isoform X2 [Mauremys reevesii]|uniref:39S ribosomal protein L9, mitochondrial isoform X2 n=1 Tax=Mauremys reevesii TaxID=260615 RepID=UPI00193FC998|nr:39S ribosomal protein L9, mitochondrial isoform X2 [Mauremys reevesii]